MSFCKFSPSYNINEKIVIDTSFITEFLPKAPDSAVKVYLLGLAKCLSDDGDNSISYFSNVLKICEEDVISLFMYWEDMGLVQILSTEPIQVRYLPVKSNNSILRKYKLNQYNNFNIHIQEIFKNIHTFVPNDFVPFYNLMEREHIDEDALLLIAKYCVDSKGFNLPLKYVLKVAESWIRDGIITLQQVEERIKEIGIVDDSVLLIFSAMGTRRAIQIEDRSIVKKWLESFGFELNVIVFVVNHLKNKKRRLDVNVLDECLTKYFEMKLMSIQEIENYENEKENLFSVAVSVNKELGIYYEDLTKEIDTYIVPWINMGFDEETLKLVADNCFKSSIKTLEGFNNIINKLFKLGIVNIDSYMQYMNDNLAVDCKIKKILEALNLSRNVNNVDRNFYSTWTNDWGFDDSVIIYAATLSKDKSNAVMYLNKILTNWNNQGVKTLEKAQATKVETFGENNFIHNNYTKEQIASLITNLDEVEV